MLMATDAQAQSRTYYGPDGKVTRRSSRHRCPRRTRPTRSSKRGVVLLHLPDDRRALLVAHAVCESSFGNLLTDRRIRAIKEPGRYTDGGGLVLQCGPSGAKSWLFVFKRSGRRTVMGLGGIASVSLAEARQKALACRKAVAEGCNPLTERRSKEEIPTFSETVATFLDDHRLAAWRNAKHREQWKMTLGPAYCRPILDLKVDEIKTADIVAVLRPIWATKSETASRLRGRIERVLAFAEVRGWRPEGKNPAQWRGHLDAILPPARKLMARGHHVAMAYRDVPAFIDQLDAAPGMAALCLKDWHDDQIKPITGHRPETQAKPQAAFFIDLADVSTGVGPDELRSSCTCMATDQPRRLFFGLRFACDPVASCPGWAGLFRYLFFFSKSGVLPDLTPLSLWGLP